MAVITSPENHARLPEIRATAQQLGDPRQTTPEEAEALINPDGRDAFAHRNHRSIGREPRPERDDWSNDFNDWEAIGFRTGHYFFDTNRDWWAHTQRETQARMARYSGPETLRISGHLWDESAERLPTTVFAYEERIGLGRVILIAEDPNFRAYWRGANRLFLNAVVLSPSAP